MIAAEADRALAEIRRWPMAVLAGLRCGGFGDNMAT
jgi:hypothetical protein